MIKLEKVTKFYKDAGRLVFAINELDLEIKKGDFVAIVGPSGAGKTTLLSLVGCLIKPSAGNIRVNGYNTTQLNDDQLSELRARKVGFVFQGSHVIPNLTVLENVMLPLVFIKTKNIAAKRKRAVALLEELGLGERINSLPQNMSGGQVKRISIARALINDPEVLLADEPTGELDQETSQDIIRILKKLNQEDGITILLVTHNQELAQNAKAIIKLRNGKLDLM
jgi:putative ABC transport system ATP-binding protein